MNIYEGRIMNDFIEPNKKQYVIPVYQRNYEWSEEQCRKLFEDIIKAHETDEQHFTGSIVFAPLNTNSSINSYVIIDGQQRLTTIYLLLKALMDCTEIDSEKERIATALFNIDKFKRYGLTESSKLKLKPIKSDNIQLMYIMGDEVENLNTESNVYKNYYLFKTLINEYLLKNTNETIEHIYDGIEHLSCATIKLGENDNAQEIFERINSTGVPLSLADKIRNYVLMTDKDQEYLYETYWANIESLITKDNINMFFLNLLHFKSDTLIKENDAYDIFKKIYNSKEKNNEDILKELQHYAKFYNVFNNGHEELSDNINTYLKDLRKLKQTTIFLFLFSLFDDLYNRIIDQKVLEDVLCLLRNYSIRHIICERGSNSLRGLYKTIYSRVFADPARKDNYYDSIVTFLTDVLTSKDRMPSDEEFKIALKEKNIYKKPVICKYLLSSIENKGKEKVKTNNLTIEHIMPQNKNLSKAWQEMLGPEWSMIQEKYLHTIGNLTLTAYNSELGDKPFAQKKQEIEKQGSKMVLLYSDIKKSSNWNEDSIKNRAENLSNTIMELYKIKPPTTKITFFDPDYKEYTIDDPTIAQSKAPNYFIIEGNKIVINTNSFAEMLQLVIEYLYDFDKEIIKDMARTNEKISHPNTTLFSYDKNITGNNKISGTDIYYSRSFSAPNTIRIITTLLNIYGIDKQEFLYSAKQK